MLPTVQLQLPVRSPWPHRIAPGRDALRPGRASLGQLVQVYSQVTLLVEGSTEARNWSRRRRLACSSLIGVMDPQLIPRVQRLLLLQESFA